MSDEKRRRAYGAGIESSKKKKGDQDDGVRCWRCGRLLAELLTRPWVIKCSRCKARNEGKPGYHRASISMEPPEL